MKRNSIPWILLGMAALTFAACKQALGPVQEPSVSDIRDYFWHGHDSTSTQTFVDDNGAITNTLTFTTGNNGFGVQDIVNTSNNKLAFDVSSSQIMGSGFRPGTIIDLDPYSHFTSLDTVVSTRARMHAAVLAKGSAIGGYFIATDRGVWFYGAKNGSSNYTFTPDQPGLVLDILASDEFNVYGVTFSGDVWVRPLSDASMNVWKPAPSPLGMGPLNAFAVLATVMYAAPKSGGIFQHYPSLGSRPWRQVFGSAIPTTEVVTALYPYNGSKLLMGTAKGVGFSFDINKQYLTYFQQSALGFPINCFLSYPNGLAIGTQNGIYFGTSDTTTWNPIVPGIDIRSMAQRDDQNNKHVYLAVISKDAKFSVFDLTGRPVTIIPKGPPHPFTQFVVGNSTVVSDTGLFTYYAGNPDWSLVAGPTPVEYPSDDGPLLMLRADATTKNDTWRAGTLVTEHEHRSYPITGQVLEHLDKLTINEHDYPDVLQVQYSDGLADTIPSWTVYYQKNRGPIMVTKSKTVSGRTTLASKHVSN